MKMRNPKLIIATTAALLCWSAGELNAQQDQSKQLSHRDKKFADEANQSNLAEIQMGQLAAKSAQSSSVKQYGEKLAKDHQQAEQKLTAICQQKGIPVTKELKGEYQKTLDHLSTAGSEFDKQFLDHAIKHHRKDIAEFEKEAQRGEDPALRSFASETLPTLREHLKIAQTLKENPNASIPELSEPAGAEPKKEGEQEKKQGEQQQQGQENQNSPSNSNP